ncbi:MAG: YceI family protein, partial [Acidimicrobiia bacterium]
MKRLIAVVAGVLVVAGAGVWFFFLRSDAPPPVSLEGAVGTTAPGATTADAAVGGTVEGVWVIASGSDSFVGYRIGERLASIGVQDAVGRTSQVTGMLQIEGTSVTAVSMEADLASLESDSAQRDRRLRSAGLETDTFPTAAFVLTAPIALGEIPTEGVPLTATARGDFTLHGVTRPVEIPVEAQLSGGAIVVVGSLQVTLTDYGITAP